MRHPAAAAAATAALALAAHAALPVGLAAAAAERPPLVAPFISVDAPVVALTHVRVIDGSGAPPREDQTVVIRDGKFASIGRSAPPKGATIVDLRGKSVIPGLVGMHEHLFYPPKLVPGPAMFDESFFVAQPYSFPRLYLAGGVTTARTAGSISPHTDLAVQRLIERGVAPGPRLDVSGPYIEAPSGPFPQFPSLPDVPSVQRLIDYWAAEGVTSFKVYNEVTRAQLAAAVAAAHAKKLKVAAHLCSVTYHEAAALGVDSLEHGLLAATDFVRGKEADHCPQGAIVSIATLDVRSDPVRALIADLVAHKVAITSTLAVFEGITGAALDPRVPPMLTAEARKSVEAVHAVQGQKAFALKPAFTNEMAFERAFVAAGGLLLSGCDPTGDGSVLPGFGDQRNLELLVQAGFTPLEAIRIGTANGAQFLGRQDIGTIAPGKRADLVVIDGNPAARISDVERVVTVFKDGVGYDSKKLLDAVRGEVGLR